MAGKSVNAVSMVPKPEVPDPEVPIRGRRLSFSARYKLEILALMEGVERLQGEVATTRACEVLGLSRATFYRHRQAQEFSEAVSEKPKRRRRSPRRLSDAERQDVLTELHSERFVDKAPWQVTAILAE